MAGFDGRGPNGAGPMTGGGRGYCGMPAGNLPAATYGRGFMGMGRGRGFRNRFYATGAPGRMRAGRGYGYQQQADLTSEDEIRMLKEEASHLKNQMEDVQKHIQTLEGSKEK